MSPLTRLAVAIAVTMAAASTLPAAANDAALDARTAISPAPCVDLPLIHGANKCPHLLLLPGR